MSEGSRSVSACMAACTEMLSMLEVFNSSNARERF